MRNCGLYCIVLMWACLWSIGVCATSVPTGGFWLPQNVESVLDPVLEDATETARWTRKSATLPDEYRRCATAHLQRNTNDVLAHCPRAAERLYAVGVWRKRTAEEVRGLARVLSATAKALAQTDPGFAEARQREANHFLDVLVASGRSDDPVGDVAQLATGEINLSAMLRGGERFDEATDAARHAVKRLAEIPEQSRTESQNMLMHYADALVGLLLHESGCTEEARVHLARCLRQQEEWYGTAGPDTPQKRTLLAMTALRFADAGVAGGFPASVGDDTLRAYQLAAQTYRKTLESQPDDPVVAFNLVQAHYWSAWIHHVRGRFADAKQQVLMAIRLSPTQGDSARELGHNEASFHALLAGVRFETGETAAAEESFRRAIELGRSSPAFVLGDVEELAWVHGVMVDHGHLLCAIGRTAQAEVVADEVLAKLEMWGSGYDELQARALVLKSHCREEAGQTTAARELLVRVAVIWEQLVARNDGDFETLLSSCGDLYGLGFVTADDWMSSASQVFGRARQQAEGLFREHPGDRTVRNMLALAMLGQADTEADPAVSRALRERAVEILRDAPGWNESVTHTETMAMAYTKLDRTAEARELVAWLVSAGLRTKSVRDLANRTGVEISNDTPSRVAR